MGHARRLGRRAAQQPVRPPRLPGRAPARQPAGSRRRRERLSHPARTARRQGDRGGQPRPAAARPGLRLARRGRRRRRRLLVRQVPHQPRAGARASRPGSTRHSTRRRRPSTAAGRTASRTSTSRTSTTTATTRSTAATSPGTPAARASRRRSTTSRRARPPTTSTSARSRRRSPATCTGPTSSSCRRPRTRTSARLPAGALQCGTTNNADGKPDTLQELALRIAALGGPAYDAAFDRNGADDRGIVAAFLYRTDRVQLLPVAASDPVLGSTPGVTYRSAALAYNADVSNPKALNADLPGDVDTSTGVDGSNVYHAGASGRALPRVAQRRSASAPGSISTRSRTTSRPARTRASGSGPSRRTYLAAIVAALQAADPQARVDAGGDLNVFPRPDDPLVPASDQLAGALRPRAREPVRHPGRTGARVRVHVRVRRARRRRSTISS